MGPSGGGWAPTKTQERKGQKVNDSRLEVLLDEADSVVSESDDGDVVVVIRLTGADAVAARRLDQRADPTLKQHVLKRAQRKGIGQ